MPEKKVLLIKQCPQIYYPPCGEEELMRRLRKKEAAAALAAYVPPPVLSPCFPGYRMYLGSK